jgi:broad specificity phosphatase PhoE
VNQAISKISKQDFDTVAVVTHGGPIKAILRQISYSFDYKTEDCAFAELEVNDGKIKVISLNGIQEKD